MTLLKKNKGFAAVILILCVYLIIGLRIYPDYPMTVDESLQIGSGYQLWNEIIDTLHLPLKRAPESGGQRYYGFAAVFPMVILEAMTGFTKDISTIYKIRHLWNFLLFFAGLIGLLGVVQRRYQNSVITALAALLVILLPRIFGDVFDNDRDVLLISTIFIFISCFDLFCIHPNYWTLLLSAFTMAVMLNTRIFGFCFLLLPLFYFLSVHDRDIRRKLLIMAGLTVLFYYILTPYLWKAPVTEFRNSLSYLYGQRSGEEANSQTLLFLGEKIFEGALPFYYLPLWIFVSTPLITSILALLGAVAAIRKMVREKEFRLSADSAVLLIIGLILLAFVVIRPHLYDCWRHFYFLYVPIIWFAINGIERIYKNKNRRIRFLGTAIIILSFVYNVFWIMRAHPYETVYLNPISRKNAAENFDRDYWRLSTAECLEILDEKTEGDAIYLIDEFASVDKISMGFLPDVRSRFHPKYYAAQSRPIEYLLANYSNYRGNERTYPYYTSIHVVERDGIKLAELYQRTHNGEISAPEVVQDYSNSILTDGDYMDTLDGSGPEQFEIVFSASTVLSGLELFSGNNIKKLPNISFESSQNGKEWEVLDAEVISPNGYRFPETEMKFLRVNVDCAPDENWSFSEILFYR